MERKSKRESIGSIFEDLEIPRKRLKVEYLDEAYSKEIIIEDLSIRQTIVQDVQSKQTCSKETPRKQLNSESFLSPVSVAGRPMTNKQIRYTANTDRNNEQCSSQTSDRNEEGEVDQVLVSMKYCFEEVSKLLKAKDKENKLLKRSTVLKPKENQLNPGESESEMLKEEIVSLTNELQELNAQKRDWDANQNSLRNQNKKLQSQVDEKTAYIENILEELVCQSKEMNSLHARIRALLEEKSKRKNDEKTAKVFISVKPLSDLLQTNPETIQKTSDSVSDNILDDVLIPMEVVDNTWITDLIVHDDSICQPEPNVGLLQNPSNSDALATTGKSADAFRSMGESIKTEEDDLSDVLIDRVVAGREDLGVKVENSNAAIDEGLDEEEMEIAELQRIIDEEDRQNEEDRQREAEKSKTQNSAKDAESESGVQLPIGKERENELDKETELEKETDLEKDAELEQEKESMKETDLEAEYNKWKAMQKENSASNESIENSRRVTTLSDEGGREENEPEDDLEVLEELNDMENMEDEDETLAEVLVEDEAFEDVNENDQDEDEDDEDEEDEEDEGWDDMTTLELEEVEREENNVFIATENCAALEKKQEIEAIVIPTDKEELESLNLLEKENDTNDINSSWLDCPLCYSPFLKVSFKYFFVFDSLTFSFFSAFYSPILSWS